MNQSFLYAIENTNANISTFLPLFEELKEVEKILSSFINSETPLIEEVLLHTLHSGGKRLRPVLLLLIAKTVDPNYPKKRANTIAACIEAIHMASIIHDDVIDQAELRRGNPTSSYRFGANASVLSGDVLLAKAVQILIKDGDLELMKLVSESVVHLSEGEVYEIQTHNDFYLPYSTYFKILELKTGSLLRCVCQLGAKIAGATPSQEKIFSDFGYYLGMAFQMTDDLLDYQGKQQITGKQTGTDLKEGCMTLPLIILRECASQKTIEKLQKMIGKVSSAEDWNWLLQEFQQSGALRKAEKIAQQQIDLAIEALKEIQNEELIEFAHIILNRQL